MILRTNIEGFVTTEDLDKYLRAKLARLDRYIPRRERPTTLIEVILTEQGSSTPLRTCQLTLKLRRDELRAKETTQHMYASIDIATADMEQQLRLHRRHNPGKIRAYTQKIRSRTGRSAGPDEKA